MVISAEDIDALGGKSTLLFGARARHRRSHRNLTRGSSPAHRLRCTIDSDDAHMSQTQPTVEYRPHGAVDVSTALLPYAGPWNPQLAAHLLRRSGFGGSAA